MQNDTPTILGLHVVEAGGLGIECEQPGAAEHLEPPVEPGFIDDDFVGARRGEHLGTCLESSGRGARGGVARRRRLGAVAACLRGRDGARPAALQRELRAASGAVR